MLTKKALQYLKSIYYKPSHPASFSSLKTLYNFVKKDDKFLLTKKDIVRYLEMQEVHTTHVQRKKAPNYYSMTVPYPKYMIDVDSFHFNFEGEKEKRIIAGIDVFSRLASARSVPDLKAATVSKALMEIIADLQPQRIRHDFGGEYVNRTVSSALKERKVSHVIANLPYKSSVVERFGRTLKSQLYKAMEAGGTTKWTALLQPTIKAYNHRIHSSLGMTPIEAEKKENTAKLWFKFRNKHFKHLPPPSDYKYDVSECVRIAHAREPLKKEFFQTFSTRLYFISARYSKSNIHRYTLKDEHNTPLRGSFVQSQLQLVSVNSDTVYRIEKILHYKRFHRKLYCYVKWADYTNKFNTYVAASDIISLEGQARRRGVRS